MNYKFINNDHQNTFILLHGTGGSLNDLVPVATYIDSKANILSLEGHILEGNYKRYFKRLAAGVLDEVSLEKETNFVISEVIRLSNEHGFDLNHTYFIGYSNGANLIASMLYIKPEFVKNAILFNSMIPYNDKKPSGKINANIILTAGKFDQMIPFSLTEKLYIDLQKSGANVTIQLTNQGHNISEANVKKALEFYNSINN